MLEIIAIGGVDASGAYCHVNTANLTRGETCLAADAGALRSAKKTAVSATIQKASSN
jgi:hypothetical protein